MSRKSTVKDLAGNIIHMIDEANGGYIIKNRQIVNQERYAELQKIQEDKRKAAQAILHQVAPIAPSTPPQSDKVTALENKVNDLGSKLDKILKALEK